MWPYLKFELKQFLTNKKNIAIYVLLFCISCYYAIDIAPKYDPIEKVDIDAIEGSYLTKKEFITSAKSDEDLHPMTALFLEIYGYWNVLDKNRLEAYKEENWKEYAANTTNWYRYTDSYIFAMENLYYNSRYYSFDNIYAEEDGHHAYQYTATRYEDYAMGDSKLSLNVFDERTAIQTLQRLLESYLPYVLLIGCLLLTVDIVLKDRKNPTVLRGFPISIWSRVVTKGVVAFIGSMLMVIPLAIGFFIIGVKYGFGDFNLGVPIYSLEYLNFSVISMGDFLFQNFMLIVCWFVLLITLILFISVLIKFEFANLIAGIALIFWEYFYYVRSLGYVKPVEWYPTTYVKIGQVVSGNQNYLYYTDAILVKQGMIVLGISTLILLLLTLILTSFRKYKYV